MPISANSDQQKYTIMNHNNTQQVIIDDHHNMSSGSEYNCLSSEDEDQLIYSSSNCNNDNKFRIITPPILIDCSASDHQRHESLPIRHVHEKFLRDAIENILKFAIFDGTDRCNKVIEWKAPEELEKVLDLKLKFDCDTDEQLLCAIRDIIKYSVKTGHPYFVNQLFSGVDPYALAGQWLTDALNPSVYTYEVSPVFTLMEEIVLEEMRKIVGYTDGNGDGIFCPGGSIANGYAISCARYKKTPDVKVYIFSFFLCCCYE